MVEELAPDHLNRLLSDLEQQLTNIVTQHQGMVYTFGGDEMVLLFGVTKSQEDDGLRAIQAIRELHQLAATYSEDFVLQSAVASGSLVARSKPDDPTSLEVTGKLMSLVRRIAGRAEEDTVLLEGETVRLVRSHYEVTENGSLPVRGKGTPLPLYELGAKRDQVSPVHGDIERGLTVFTGRQRELDMIQRCYERVLGGEGQFVTLNGEAGLGKSRLSYEFRNSLKEEDVTLLMGRCQSYANHIPYVPFLEVLRAALGIDSVQHLPDTHAERVIESIMRIDENLSGMIPLYLHLLGIRHPEYSLPEGIEGANLRRAINESFSALFIALSQEKPFVLVLDDWHWSDEGSRDILNQWVEFLDPYKILVLLTYRPVFIPDWGHPECHTSIRLRPLDHSGATSIIADLTKAEKVPESVAQMLVERTEGNPFFLEELVNSMLESNLIRVDKNTLSIQGEINQSTVPSSVQAVLLSRLERLGSDARKVLHTASVIGRSFSITILKELIPDNDSLQSEIDEIRKRGLLQQTKVLPEIEFRFKHALVQEVVYESLLSHRRKALHGQVAEAFESLYPDQVEEQPFRLAQHFALSELWMKAVEYGQKAVDISWSSLQYREALAITDLILTWIAKLEDSPTTRQFKLENLLKKDYLCESLFLREDRKRVLQEFYAEINLDTEKEYLCEYYIRMADSLIEDFEFGLAEEHLSKGCEIARDINNESSLRKALRSLGWLYWRTGRIEQSQKINLDILQSLEATDQKDKQLGVLVSLSMIAISNYDIQNARTYIEEAEKHIGDRITFIAASIYYTKGRVEYLEGNFAQAEKTLKYSLEIWESILSGKDESKHGVNVRVPMVFVLMGNMMMEQNRFEEAELYLNKALSSHRSVIGRLDEEADVLLALGNFLSRTGRLKESIKHLEDAEIIYKRHNIKPGMMNVYKSLALAYEQSANYPGSFVSWERLSELAKELDKKENRLLALEGKARVARLQQRDVEFVISLSLDVLNFAQEINDISKIADIQNTLGILNWNQQEYASALTHFTTAYDLFTELDDAIHAGLMLNSIGAAQAKLDLIDEAVDTFQRALTHHDQTGEKLLKGHALAALGDIERDRGNYQQALTHYGDSLQLRWDIEDRAGEGWMLERIGKIHILEEKLPEARKELQKALEIAQECGESKLQLACQQSLSNLS